MASVACSGGQLRSRRPRRRGGRSFRRATTPARMNRHDGPQDGSSAGPLPHRRVAGIRHRLWRQLSPHRADTERRHHRCSTTWAKARAGRRNIVMSGSPHLPAGIRQSVRQIHAARTLGGRYARDRRDEFQPEERFPGHAYARTCICSSAGGAAARPRSEYAVTIEDSRRGRGHGRRSWSSPSRTKQEETEYPLRAPRCVEGNYAFPAMMRAARVEDPRLCAGTRSRTRRPRTTPRISSALSRIRSNNNTAGQGGASIMLDRLLSLDHNASRHCGGRRRRRRFSVRHRAPAQSGVAENALGQSPICRESGRSRPTRQFQRSPKYANQEFSSPEAQRCRVRTECGHRRTGRDNPR